MKEISMKVKTWRSVVVASALMSVFLTGAAIGENKAPTEGKGIQAAEPVFVDLGQGLRLRTRVFIVEPGGVIPLHSHKDDPTVAYYYGGPLSEFNFDGKAAGLRGGGKAYADDRSVNHWYENRSHEAATVVVSDVVK
jgi:quercetin dioxygenase-like cupin family protein